MPTAPSLTIHARVPAAFIAAAISLLTAALSCAGPLAAAIPSDELLHSLQPTGDVNDYAGILSPAEKEALEQRCRELRQKTGAELAVVVLDSLHGGEIDDFTNKLFARWGVGQKEQDNGILLLVALQDRKARIEVGYGLEPILPDALAGRILDEQLFPAFREQRYAAGLSAAVNRIVDIVVRGEPAPAQVRAPGPMELPLAGAICFTLFLIPFTALPAFMIGLGTGSKQVGPIIGATAFLVISAVMLMAPGLPWWGWATIAPFDAAAGYLGWRTARKTGRGTQRRSRTWRGGGGSWMGGWNWGGTGGGSSWSGGGFSGGGGGFGGGHSGGGGASGGW
jgi:uncharacterized protein